MAVRAVRGARPRRPARGGPLPPLSRPRLRGLALVSLYAAAAVVATAPAVASFRSAFIAGGAAGAGQAAAGDHLQSVYRFWLVGHQLEHGRAPWRDPYSFQPLVEQQLNLNGWPFGIPFWPLDALFGPVVAWNTLLLAGIVLAGIATHGWLRCLRVPAHAAAIGGLAFAIAPYRLAQSGGHLLGWIAVLVPVALLAFERARAARSPWRAAAWGALSATALASVPLSGQVHLAIGALPFVLAYALVRLRRGPTLWVAAGAAAGAAVGVLVREHVVEPSVQSGGRSLDQVEQFQSDWVDLVSRFRLEGLEQYAYVGWLTPVLAVAGAVLLVRRRPWLAALLAVAAVVPLLVAVGTNMPGFEPLWRHVPGLRYTRVPGRLVPLADLAIAALAAVAVARGLACSPRARRPLVAAVALLLVAGDLLVLPLRATAADPGNAAYRALVGSGRGRALELPLFEPGIHFGSIYHYYALQAPRQRPAGYSTLVPEEPYLLFWELNRVNCGVLLPQDERRLGELGVRFVLFHAGAYEQARRPGAWFAWQSLQRAGYRAAAHGGRVWLVRLRPDVSTAPQPAPVPEPDRNAPVLCEGWRGWTMSERDAPLWVYGGADIELGLTVPGRSEGYALVDGSRLTRFEVDGRVTLLVPLEGERWHSILLQIPALLDAEPAPRGFTIERLTYR